MKFVNKKDIIEGIQYTGDNIEEIVTFVEPAAKIREEFDGIYLIDKYNKSPFELNINKLTDYEKDCLIKGLKLRGYNEESIKLLFK